MLREGNEELKLNFKLGRGWKTWRVSYSLGVVFLEKGKIISFRREYFFSVLVFKSDVFYKVVKRIRRCIKC